MIILHQCVYLWYFLLSVLATTHPVPQTGDTSLALSGQLLYSLLATGANLSMVVGALGRRPLALLPWLLLYGLAVVGALALALLLPLTVVFRDRDLGDNSLADTAW